VSRIAWITDLDPLVIGGGAQLNDRLRLIEGIRRGHNIEIVTPVSERPRKYDLAILHNITSFPRDYLLDLKPRVICHHDYPCKWRLHWPMLEKCKRCVDRDFWLKLMAGAELNFFLSTLHRDSIRAIYPEVNGISVPSAMNPKPFLEAKGEHRKNTALIINLYTFKGVENVLAYLKKHSELIPTFHGSTNHPEIKINSPPVPSEELPSIYARHEYFIHLPKSPQPFERTAAEALFAGCKLILNEKVGATSWPWWGNKKEVAGEVAQAPKRFWDIIQKEVIM